MGTIKQGILGGFSGKVGSVIGGTWKGISYMRGISLSHADPQTDAQLAVRAKFKAAMAFVKTMSEFLKIGWKNFAVRMTAMNAAFQYTIKNAVLGTYPTFTIDYPNALVARGNLARPLNQVSASTVAGTVHFTWDDNSDEGNADATDETLLLLYNPVKKQSVYFAGLAERADGTQTVTGPGSFSGDLVHCYLAFRDLAGLELSNSAYAGAVTVA
jgi:hypothetical protein